ncbi:hypothetical protein TSYNTROOL_19860 [Tepidanaerobacter syntrophicus]|uniref:DapH/DapD/GlmU-related protein n=1 Tax=Tepidanaerobacter syntrophicus TaxID=224999 RepID=UPI0022EF61BF|nr:DapH/DapD/GlmU-related protein [Tepidanaerobacter syntrophicus]GLI51900.1 hypothetical protein TSYNTROOL_19860 [Tepidanaerobacter syntrophicus]
MEIKVKQVLKYLRDSNLTYDYYGKLDIYINGYSSLNNLQSNSITWVKNKTYYNDKLFFDVNNILVVAKSDILDEIKKIDYKGIGFIICNDPKQIFFTILSNFFNKEKRLETFISPTSVVETDKIGQNVYIGHNSYIGKNVVIGDNTVIENNASIYENTVIGKNTIIHSGAVIGKDGFGYFKNSEGKNIKVPHYGKVIIGESVEIGANTCIDKGTLGDTVIGSNVKISSLCHIAYNLNIQEIA